MRNTSLRISFAAVLCLGVVSAFGSGGQKWYCTRNDTGKDYQSFKTPSYWHLADGTEMTEFSSEDDYYLCNSTYFSGSPTFPGGPLHFGCVAEDKSVGISIYSGNINTHGVFLENGSIRCNRYSGSSASAHTLSGDCTVVSPRSAPFRVNYGYGNTTFYVTGAVAGGTDTALLFNGGTMTEAACSFTDVSAYHGLITVTSMVENTSSTSGLKLLLRCSSFPGSIDMWGGTVLQMNGDAANSAVTISNMTFHAGSRIVITGTSAVHSSFSATGSVTAETGVEIVINFAVPISYTTNTIVLLSAPVDRANFTKDDFVLDASKSDWKQTYHLDTVVVDGVKSLVAVFDPLIEQTGQYPKEYEFKDTEDCRPSSMTNASYWSDGQVPHGGMRYAVVSRNLRTPYEPNATGVFAGACLILEGGHLHIFNSDYTITNLIVAGGSLQTGSAGSNLKTLHFDNIFVCEGKTLSFETYLGRGLEIDSEITGSGDLVFRGISRSGATSAPGAYYILRKPNENFFGTVRVSQYDIQYLDFASKFQTLRIADGRCLGGTLPEFNPAALFLGHYSRLTVIGPSVELESGRNRGVYIEGCGRFYVDKTDGSNDLLVCNWPITLNGALYKEGSGRLELGGAAYFQGEDSIGDTPRANSNLFFVAGGSLMPRRHDCCDGMAISFSSGTKLVIPLGGANAELAKYGLYNAKEGGSVAIDGKLDVELDTSAAATPQSYNFTVGLVTVTNTLSATEAVRGKLNVTAHPYAGYSARVVETLDPDNDVVVFAANVRHYGMTLRIR